MPHGGPRCRSPVDIVCVLRGGEWELTADDFAQWCTVHVDAEGYVMTPRVGNEGLSERLERSHFRRGYELALHVALGLGKRLDSVDLT